MTLPEMTHAFLHQWAAQRGITYEQAAEEIETRDEGGVLTWRHRHQRPNLWTAMQERCKAMSVVLGMTERKFQPPLENQNGITIAELRAWLDGQPDEGGV